MKRSLLIAGAAVVALSLAACGEKAKTEGAATPAEQAATPDASPAAAVITPADETKAATFVNMAGGSDMYEIEASKIALTRSTNPEVKKLAQMMIEAHTKTTADLKAAIAKTGDTTLTPPLSMPETVTKMLDELKAADAKDFDKKYADAQVDAHQKTLNTLQHYAQAGDNKDLMAFAAATAPAVQMHLNMAEGLKKGL